MTDTTDIKALQRPTRKHYDWSKAVWMDCDRCGEAHTGTVLADDGARICAGCCDSEFYSAWEDLAETAIKLLEAERQRLELVREQRDNELRTNSQLEEEIAALKGKLVPVAVVELNDNLTVAEIRGDIPRRKAVRELYEGALVLGQELFTAPQKPVVLPEGFYPDGDIDCELVINLSDAIAAIEAAGGIVKDGE